MKFGISANFPWFGPPFVDLARHMEACGLESLWTGEHIMIPVEIEDKLRYGVPLPENYQHMPEVFISMAAAAAVTKTLIFGTDICLVSQREPIALAKAVATLDRIAGGRFIFGIGHGWIVEESEIMGAPFRKRVKIATERTKAIIKLWTEEQPSFAGEYVNFPPIHLNPKPLQKPHPPVLIGSGNDKTDNTGILKRVVDFADGWLPAMLSPEQARDQIAQLREMCAAAGRDFSKMDITLLIPAINLGIGERPPWASDMTVHDKDEAVAAYEAAGVNRMILGLDDMTDEKSFDRITELATALKLM